MEPQTTCSSVARFKRVGHRPRQCRRLERAGRREDALDLHRGDERPRRVVHRHVATLLGEFGQAGTHRILPVHAACDHALNFPEGLLPAQLFQFGDSLWPANENDFVDTLRRFESRDGVSHHWLVA